MPYGPDMRASDDDREKIASRLRDAHAEGRLSLGEFQDRLDALYSAQTYGELEPLVRDLPVTRAPRTQAVVPGRPPAADHPARSARRDKGLAVMWTIWAAAVAVNLVVWLLVSITNGLEYFWPIWVAGPWGAVLGTITVARRYVRD
ncbi:DUF1707 domain-containing protein [Actinopolymorpha sp. NPDC004070]|uniref:DUF1707 SHOCT-like domain-containing protein n=1 Tax=Actinopolymorpha sp. NPDC004070 TaxID=3154548 RepID=UPI0033B77C65